MNGAGGLSRAPSIMVGVLALVSLSGLLLVVGAAFRPLVEPPDAGEPVLNDVEVGFVQDMVIHHQQALQMTARLSPDFDPTVVAFADRIDAAQRIELGTLLGWLTLAEAPPTNPDPMWWHRAAHTHAGAVGSNAGAGAGESMPGMATLAELDALSAARGRDGEVLFLQLMRRHHEGGVAMARSVDLLLDDGPVKRMARAMMQEQSKESGLMTIMLAERGALPAG
ncbi:DUF305 domain-containing protein [Rhodococcus sp. SJ-3]|uniref:DUF305 domain-containing protein n=1 Tax=Rhodococcus sp. SJ-3 TaxID=3454628 RepID=UPI003F7933FD